MAFTPATFRFLSQLENNNNREWFAEHKQDYENYVRTPALDFITAMNGPLRRFAPCFDAIPKKIGGSLMRIHRDTRFARDKSPYKTNIGIQFRHQVGKDVHAPGFYLHLDTQQCFLGVGIWRPDSDALKAIRQRIAEKPEHWKKVISAAGFRSSFLLAGESLSRPPRGFDKTHPMIEDLKRKDFIAIHHLSRKEVLDGKFVNLVNRRFNTGKNFMQFLCTAVGLNY